MDISAERYPHRWKCKRNISVEECWENFHLTFEQQRKAEGKGKQKLHFHLQSENNNWIIKVT